MKRKVILGMIIVLAILITGCTQAPATTDDQDTGTETKTEETADAVTTASIVDTEEAFIKAISKDGTWLIATLNDLKIDSDLVLDGDFVNGKKDDAGNDIVQRKIGLYTQDEARNVTARFTLTAPKLTINSPKASIEHGTFVGDLYVNASDFQLKGQKIEGNLYFTTPEAQATFMMDETSSVTGVQELKQ
ncbi:hypothetical protein [uncultured Acetobacterium sp.]|uniref:hypothetical protein n=1 Tax=uncultured Acetobacterium sp. TaxID=217139 RepID=UPI0025E3CF30|nr:hypothetical protein [uncultured Acetobacterium sp.]